MNGEDRLRRMGRTLTLGGGIVPETSARCPLSLVSMKRSHTGRFSRILAVRARPGRKLFALDQSPLFPGRRDNVNLSKDRPPATYDCTRQDPRPAQLTARELPQLDQA